MKPGQSVISVELKDFDHNSWRDGFMNTEHNCSHFARAKCLIATSNGSPGPDAIIPHKETLVVNKCQDPIVAAGAILRSGFTDIGANWNETESKGYWKIAPGQSRIIKGGFLMIKRNGKIVSKNDFDVCTRHPKEFHFKKISSSSECQKHGGHMAGFENVSKYKKWTACR